MKKKVFTAASLAALSGLAAVALASCGKTWTKPVSPEYSATVSDGGKVVNIKVWNDEFINLFEKYYPNNTVITAGEKYKITVDGNEVTVVFSMTPNKDNAYQNALDLALSKQETAAADDKVDMFLFEADYALKYVNTNYTVDVKDLGITDTDTADMYKYTKDVATANGHLKGVSWQATPGLFAYRTDIADAVLGTHEPEAVQAQLSDWSKFDAVAAKMKEKNYKMLSGYDDSYRVFSNNISSPLVDMETGKIKIDQKLKDWIKQTKDYSDKGYNNKTSLWDNEWSKQQTIQGNTFGFFYSTWGINFTLKGNALTPEEGPNLDGKWRVVEGPASYYWGGTWMAAANGTDNKKEVAAIMKNFTCNKAVMKRITEETLDYTNNKPAMNELATSTTFGPENCKFLGGQNHIALFAKSAEKIDLKNISAWDQGINEKLQEAMKDYFAGTVTEDKAWENFDKKIEATYPELMGREK